MQESNLDLALAAGRTALEKSGLESRDIGVLIVATFSGDYYVPSMASLVQAELGLPENVLCYDLNAACSGFIFAVETARALLTCHRSKAALIIGSEVISRKLDMTDRGTCILFGDGAGAVVLTLQENKLYQSICRSRGDAGGISCSTSEEDNRKIHMDGQAIYKFAVSTVPALVEEVLSMAGSRADEIDWFICHQANARILDSIARTLHQPKDRFYRNIEEYGNTSAASIPIAISEMDDKGLLKPGQKIVLAGFGAGLTWGSILLEW